MSMLFMVLLIPTGFAQEITIDLMPGWNWISYPNAVSMQISEALGDFAPMEGDIIQSQFGGSTYINGRWRGGITHFMPGLGYMYYSARNEFVSFVFENPSPIIVTTSEPTNIYGDAATGGGSVTSSNGGFIMMKGICWATHPQPTTNDFYSENGSGLGTFVTEMTNLSQNTTYYVRAYATNNENTIYGNELSFTTLNGNYGGHYYVDLGLPSGTLWAEYNVGANAPEEYGDYFAWGETNSKSNYSWGTYQHCNGTNNTFTKYCTQASYGYNNFVDNLTILLPEDDAATVNWGSGWRMPSESEWEELYTNTTHTWTTRNGVKGRLFTAANGNTIFLPAAGYHSGNSFFDASEEGYYWSNSLHTNSFTNTIVTRYASCLYFTNTNCKMWNMNYDTNNGYRSSGNPVRPVRSPSQN